MAGAPLLLARRLAWAAGGPGPGEGLGGALAVSAVGYAALALLTAAHGVAMPLCLGGAGLAARTGRALAFALATRLTPAALAMDLAMLAAMTAPLLAPALRLAAARSFPGRRRRAVALVAASYGAVWLAAMVILDLVAGAVMAAGADSRLALLAAAGLAAAWQLTPARARLVEACRQAPALNPFGAAADRACLGQGARLGLACAGACAPAMALAMLAPVAWLACLVAGAAALAERLHRRPPRRALALAVLAAGALQAAMAG